jgi:ABC-2 type transport system permease protein/sodium transport system permease protein
LIPLMLAALAPGVLSLFPWLRLTPALSAAPLLNIVLLVRDLFRGEAEWTLTFLVLLSTAVYAAAALASAAHIFGSESVLYGDSGGWAALWRRPAKPRSEASLATAAFVLALALPAFLLLNGLASRWAGGDVLLAYVGSSLVLAMVFAGLPLAATGFCRISLDSGLGLRRFPPPATLGALLLGVSLWPLALEAYHLTQGPDLLQNPELQERAKTVLEQIREIPPVLRLLLYAVIPGVCEELFFRGLLFGALVRREGPATAILVTAVVFGAFHMVGAHSLTPERALPTTLLGVVLGWLRWQSGSTIPGMLLHTCHNGLLLSALDAPEVVAKFVGSDEHNWLLGASLVVAALGFWVVSVFGKSDSVSTR